MEVSRKSKHRLQSAHATKRLPLAGPAKAFDSLLDSWLTRALELGMIGSGLGQVFPVNLERSHKEGRINAEQLLIVGMGDPGRFASDDLRYLMSNVIVAVKSFEGRRPF